MQSFREPLIVSGVKTPQGSKTVAIFAGSSDDVYVIDADTGKMVWQKKLKWASSQPQEPGEGRGFICTNALSATPVITPAGAKERVLYVITTDGYLHLMDPATGDEKDAPVQMLPSVYGKPYGLNLVNGVVYTITGQGCGGVPNALYAYNTVTKKVTMSTPPQGGLWGTAGPAIGSDGTIYFESGDHPYDAKAGLLSTSVQAYTFSNDTLKLKDYYTPKNWDWLRKRDLDPNNTPTIFNYKGRELLAASGKECRVYLLDPRSPGGADHQTPLYKTPLFCNEEVDFQDAGSWGALSTWEDPSGTRWVLAPFWGPVHSQMKFPITNTPAAQEGGVAAFKVEDKDGQPALTPAWVSRDMHRGEPVMIVNGIVFGYGSGEETKQSWPDIGLQFDSTIRAAKGTHATIYALDAETGKELWTSGDQMHMWNHFSGITVVNGRVYLGTYDGTLYCFGVTQ